MRAQLLATEHWGLLAARGTAQSEVLTRISMLLTLVSAALVSLALVGQATRFSDSFSLFAIAVLGVVVLVGSLTQVRVFNVGLEDLMYVLAMNRLRGAYAELDPGVARMFMTSTHDDRQGSAETYYFLGPRGAFSQVAGSSMVFIAAVNSTLIGLFVSSVGSVLAAPLALTITLGVACGLAYLVISMITGQRRYALVWRTHRPEFPTPPPQ